MACRGFPIRFCQWIHTLLSTATSSVLLNGREGQSFKHVNGLRQGDPLSPYLFLLAADVMQRMMNAISTSIPHSLSNRVSDPIFMLQYADDTLLFATARGNTLRKLAFTLDLFSKISGLFVNCEKSSFVPFNLSQQVIYAITQIFNFPLTELPMDYLGLPLSITKPRREHFTLLIQRIQRRIDGWKSKLLSRAGRLQLCKAVINSIPCYFMTSFLLPKWVLRDIDKMCRNFLWRNASSKGCSLLNWDTVCRPKKIGGFGLLNLSCHNKCLLLRWWWRLYDQQPSLWKLVATLLLPRANLRTGPLLWKKSGSFFWKNLFELRHLFQFSTTWSVRSGKDVSFWFDSWGGAPMRFFIKGSDFQVPHYFASVSKMISENWINQDLPRNYNEDHRVGSLLATGLTNGDDSIHWRWSPDGRYSAAGLYKVLMSSGRISSRYSGIWRLRATPNLKVFLFLLLHGKLLTQDVLQRRGMILQPRCYLCNNQTLETHRHLFSDCTHTAMLLNALGADLGPSFSALVMQQTPLYELCYQRRNDPAFLHQCLVGYITCYRVWHERNARIFRNTSRHLVSMVHEMIKEATWMIQCC